MELNRLLRFSLLAVTTLALASCAGRTRDLVEKYTSDDCRAIARSMHEKDPLDTLALLSSLVYKKCDAEAIEVGKLIRAKFRDKTYSTTFEIASLFVPEEKLTSYVLESYERVYLAFLISTSYLNLGKREAAAVELRQAYNEGKAAIYNFGDDPLNCFVMAAAWENLGDRDAARPFWKRVSELAPKSDPIKNFAAAQMKLTDAGVTARRPASDAAASPAWRIHWVGALPELDYELVFMSKTAGGYYKITPKSKLPESCASPTGARLSAKAWIAKIGVRYNSDYHPLMNVKSWLRAPVGLTYGAITVATGLSIGVGGCALSIYGGSASGCGKSFEVGSEVVGKSTDVVGYMLKPDLRHWSQLPGSILITRSQDVENEECWWNLEDEIHKASFELTRGPVRAPASQTKKNPDHF